MRTQLVSACILLLAGSAWANAPWLKPISERSRNFAEAFARLNDYVAEQAQPKRSVSSFGRKITSVDKQLQAIKQLVASNEFAGEKDQTFRELSERLSKFELAPEKRCQFENVKALTSTVDFISDLDESAFRSEKRGNGLTAMILQYAKTLGGCFAELDKAWQEMITPEELEKRHGDMKVFDIANTIKGTSYDGERYDTAIFKAAEKMESETFATFTSTQVFAIAQEAARKKYGSDILKLDVYTGRRGMLYLEETEKFVKEFMYKPCENLDDIEPILEPVIKLAKLAGIPDKLRQDDGNLSLLLYAARYMSCKINNQIPLRENAVVLLIGQRSE